MRKKVLTILLLLCCFMLTLGGCDGCTLNLGRHKITYTEPLAIGVGATASEIAEEYLKATVTVVIVDSSNSSVSHGSGVAIHSGGYIATNYHVISSVVSTSSSYSAKVYLNEGETGYDADVLWYNVSLDCAILRSDYYNIPFVQMEDRWIDSSNPLKVLEQVIAIGTPIDFSLQNTVSTGYISSTVKRYSTSENRVYEDLIQHTAPISNGNSGGPLFDLNGKLIGLNTLGIADKQATATSSGYSANSLFFSVPIYPIMEVIDRVVAGTFVMPQVGVTGNDSTESALAGKNNISEDGFYVVSLTSGGAAQGHLSAGDVIKKITNADGKTFVIEERNDMIYALLSCKPGDTVTIEYKRLGLTRSTEITLK